MIRNAMTAMVKFLCAGIGSALLIGAPTSASAAASSGAVHNLNGVWWIENYDPQLLPTNGHALPFTDQGLAHYLQNIARLKIGDMQDMAVSACLPEGLPRAMNSAYPLQIVQHDRLITVIHEANHEFWNIALNGNHPDADDINPAFMGGSSVGHWEGDTLVVDSVGFKTNSFIDATGVPHSDQLHVVLRLRKMDGGRRMEAMMTVEDPEIFTSPWTARRTYQRRTDVELMEFACDAPHRYLPGTRSKAVLLKWSRK